MPNFYVFTLIFGDGPIVLAAIFFHLLQTKWNPPMQQPNKRGSTGRPTPPRQVAHSSQAQGQLSVNARRAPTDGAQPHDQGEQS